VAVETDDEKVNLYRLERSNRVICDKPHAAQMDVAFDENADVNVIRGPNSTTNVLSPSVELNNDCSNFNPSFSKVSRNNHSNRSVDVVSRLSSFVSCTLKQLSVSILSILDASSLQDVDWESCSLIDGRRECGVSVRR